MVVPCVDCVPGDFGWPVGIGAPMGWGSWDTLCRGCSGGGIGGVVGMDQDLRGADCTRDTMVGQLKLECRLWYPQVLHSQGPLAGGLEPR